MTEHLPHGPLRTLLNVWLLLNTSAWAFVVAIAVQAYNETGAAGVGIVTAARVLPAFVVAPIAGHTIDRRNRAWVVAAFTAGQALAAGGTAVLVLASAPFAVIVPAVALVGALAAAPRPALQAQLPALARTPDELTHATAAWSALDNVGFLLGSGFGGIAIAVLGPGPVLAIAAGVCALAAVAASRLPASEAIRADEEVDEESLSESLAGGLRALREIPALRTPFALLAGILILEGATDVQIVTLALADLDLGEGGPGALFAAWGIGGIWGGATAVLLLRRRGYGLALAAGALMFGLALALAGSGGVTIALLALIPTGLAFALVETAAMGLVPRLADDAVVGRVYGLSELTYAAGGGIGALLAPPLIDWLGAPGSMVALGCTYALLALLAWRPLSRLDEGQEEATRVRSLLRGVPFIAPLPLPRLERLVQGARPLSLPAGETIISKGDAGEEFFVIESGTVEVLEFGRTQQAGDGFGEIALLRDVPRTATVRAATDVRLRVLARPSFLAAMTEDGDAAAASAAVVDEHLARPLSSG